jgi:hypothetical protein
MRKMLTAVLGSALALAIHASPAAADASLTFVAATGSDGNPCTVEAQPCKTLQRAITVTPASGEIRLLSNLPLQAPSIAKSLTINGGGNTMLGKITINSASAIVTLRRLNVSRGGGAYVVGVNIVNAAAVHIEECTVERFTQRGILLVAGVSTELFVSDTALRDNGNGLVALGPTTAKVTIDNSLFENNQFDGVSVAGGQTSISRSVSSGGDRGFSLNGGTMNITNSTAASNAVNGFAVFAGVMTIKSSTGRGNVGAGLGVDSGATATIATSTFTNNATGVFNNGIVYSLEDNTIDGNTTEVGGTALDTATVNPL